MYNDTSSHSMICAECVHTVNMFGLPCILMLYDICNHYLLSESLNYSENYVTELYQLKSTIMFLEKKGYVLTTEIDQHRIGVFPNTTTGRWDCLNQYFCWCK